MPSTPDDDALTMAATGPVTSSGWLTSSDSISHGRLGPGAILDGRYRIIAMLGKGGMGEVYRADRRHPVALAAWAFYTATGRFRGAHLLSERHS